MESSNDNAQIDSPCTGKVISRVNIFKSSTIDELSQKASADLTSRICIGMDSNSIFIVGHAYPTYQIFKLMIDTLELTRIFSADTASEYEKLYVSSLLYVAPLNTNNKIGAIAIVDTAIPKNDSGKRLNFLRLAVFDSARGSNPYAKEKQFFQLKSCPSTENPNHRLMIGQVLNGRKLLCGAVNTSSLDVFLVAGTGCLQQLSPLTLGSGPLSFTTAEFNGMSLLFVNTGDYSDYYKAFTVRIFEVLDREQLALKQLYSLDLPRTEIYYRNGLLISYTSTKNDTDACDSLVVWHLVDGGRRVRKQEESVQLPTPLEPFLGSSLIINDKLVVCSEEGEGDHISILQLEFK